MKYLNLHFLPKNYLPSAWVIYEICNFLFTYMYPTDDVYQISIRLADLFLRIRY